MSSAGSDSRSMWAHLIRTNCGTGNGFNKRIHFELCIKIIVHKNEMYGITFYALSIVSFLKVTEVSITIVALAAICYCL